MTLLRRNQSLIAARAQADLAAEKVLAVAAVNHLAGVTRQKYITTIPGQDMIYMAKEREALAFLAAPTTDLMSYPMIAAEIGITAPTPWQLAQVWANVSVYWRGVAAQIEGARMQAIADVEAATSVHAVVAVSRSFRPM